MIHNEYELENWLDSHDEDIHEPVDVLAGGCMKMMMVFVIGIVVLVLCGLFTSCTTTKYVTVPEVHEHWHHSSDTIRQTDSIIDHQTTTIREVDSATMAQYGIQMKDMQRAWLIETNRLQRELSELRQSHTDTIHERDSIPYPVEVVKEVPAQLSWWQQTRLHIADILLWVMAIIFGYWVARKFILKK